MLKVAGVVVLYNPPSNIIQNINSYINQIDYLWIIDNSSISNHELFQSLQPTKFFYFPNFNNIGIATALNIAANCASGRNFDLLLTMDQDSRVSNDLVVSMLKEFEKNDTIGIISPHVIHPLNPRKPQNQNIHEITIAITSGCILRLSVFKIIGGFLEKLFIDYVDHEYCLRMISKGFKVMKLNSAYIYHSLGNIETRKFFNKKVYPTNHSPIRWYYRTRNRFYIYQNYKSSFPQYVKKDKIIFIKELLKIILYESEKTKKMLMIIRGYLDYKNERYGKLVS